VEGKRKIFDLKDVTSSFLAKSAETIEKKQVEFLVSATKCKKAQKSAQECEKKELESYSEFPSPIPQVPFQNGKDTPTSRVFS